MSGWKSFWLVSLLETHWKKTTFISWTKKRYMIFMSFPTTGKLCPSDTRNDASTLLAKGKKGKGSCKAFQVSLIDNRSLRYSLTELQCFLWNENENHNTWTVVTLFCRSERLTKILPILCLEIENALSVLPRSIISFLAWHIPIWINDSYKVGPSHNPIYYQHCTTHHAKEWLIG